MKLYEKLRAFGFWTLDIIKGGNIRKHYNEIHASLNNSLPYESDEKSGIKIKNLLTHAVKTCDFYSRYSLGNSLSDFPIVNKNLIKSNQDLFFSSAFKNQKVYSVTTSGSTGTPFKTYQDKNKKARNYADTIYFAGLAGYKIGHRLIYLKIWVKSKMRHKLEYWFQNTIPVDVIHLNDRLIDILINKLEHDRSTFGILGYASALELICRYLDKNQSGLVRTKVKSVIAISETLNDYTKSTIGKYFSVPVVSRYSNLENGIIAQQELNGSDRFLINTASYYIEILKLDTDEPATTGELGRIVVTDLYNYALPMIRYDTGDIGALEYDKLNNSKQYLSKVEGRKLDLLYDTKGELVSSYIVYKNMWQYTEIDQYQLIQEGEKLYTFKINSQNIFSKENQLIDEFKSFLGTDADFRVEYVSEIPLLASGKRKKIVNNYIKT